jgi:ClpP class serine protease
MDAKTQHAILADVLKTIRELQVKLTIARAALWLGADALHNNDMPRETETDDVMAWMQTAEDAVLTRIETGREDVEDFARKASIMRLAD